MALIKPSPIISAISGSLSGLVFKHTRSGTVASKIPSRCNMKSPWQLKSRAVYTKALAAWHSLDSSTRTAWSTAARNYNRSTRLGGTAPASPWSLFFEANYYLLAAGDLSGISRPTSSHFPGPQYVIAWFPLTQQFILAPYPEIEEDPTWLIAVHAGRTFSPTPTARTPQHVFCPNAYWYTLGGENRYIFFMADLTPRQGFPLLGEYLWASVQYYAPGFLPSAPVTTFWSVGPTDQPKPQ